MSDELPVDIERDLNRRGIYFREMGLGRFIVENRAARPPRYLGRNPIWRHDPHAIRNYFHTKQDAYMALTEESDDLDMAAILRLRQ